MVKVYTCTYILYNNISGYGGSGGGSVLMGAILLRQMLICYIVKTPDGLTDSEIWGSGILSAVLFVRARARDVPRRRTLPLPFCIQRKTHPAPFAHPQYTTVPVTIRSPCHPLPTTTTSNELLTRQHAQSSLYILVSRRTIPSHPS